MAAEDVGKPPTHARRCTPDHPPYAVMIDAAIRSSSEGGGSTMAAISRYIRSNYDDIPEGHDRLLPYYLRKLTAQGEFVMTAPGRFAVAGDAGAEPAQPSSQADHAKPIDDDPGTTESPPPPSSSKGSGSSGSMAVQGNGSAWAQPKPTAHEGDIIERIEALGAVSRVVSKPHASTLPSQRDTVEASDGALATANRGDGSKTPVHKRRGRPPKIGLKPT